MNKFQVRYADSPLDVKLTLYQYATCPFCCKVRAFLNYYGISHDIVEVDPLFKTEAKWSKWGKVPVLVAQQNDKIIVSHILIFMCIIFH